MKPVDPKRVFPLSKRLSPFKTYLNPNRVCADTVEKLEDIASAGDMTKAEVVRYCIEFALLNADWFEAAHMKREFKGDRK